MKQKPAAKKQKRQPKKVSATQWAPFSPLDLRLADLEADVRRMAEQILVIKKDRDRFNEVVRWLSNSLLNAGADLGRK